MTDAGPNTEKPEDDWGRDRMEAARTCELAPHSLVGSWFHKLDDEVMVWQGIIVGEPQAGVYLLEIEQIGDAKKVQRLVTLRSMVEAEKAEWRFYDTDEEMRLAYTRWAQSEQETA